MKDFFEDLGKRLGETAEAVTNKAGEAVEVQRLRSQIRSLEKENEKDLAEIGRMIYRQYQKKESVDAEAEAYCEAVESREESIREYRRKIIRVRGGVKCNVCGRMVAKDMIFCPYCGEKMPDERNEKESGSSAAAENENSTEETNKNMGQEAQDFADKMKGKAADTARKAADMSDKAAQKAAEGAEKAAQKTAEGAEKAAQKTAEGVEKAAQKTAEGVEKAADAMDKAVHKTADVVGKAAQKTADMTQKAADVVDKAVHKTAEAVDKAAEK